MAIYPVLKADYSKIDPFIEEWVSENALCIQRVYKEVEVRSVEFSKKNGGRMSQIWIDPPEDSGSITVHVWDFNNPVIDLSSAGERDFRSVLDEALRIANSFE
jgi:hypothetical protein